MLPDTFSPGHFKDGHEWHCVKEIEPLSGFHPPALIFIASLRVSDLYTLKTAAFGVGNVYP